MRQFNVCEILIYWKKIIGNMLTYRGSGAAVTECIRAAGEGQVAVRVGMFGGGSLLSHLLQTSPLPFVTDLQLQLTLSVTAAPSPWYISKYLLIYKDFHEV